MDSVPLQKWGTGLDGGDSNKSNGCMDITTIILKCLPIFIQLVLCLHFPKRLLVHFLKHSIRLETPNQLEDKTKQS